MTARMPTTSATVILAASFTVTSSPAERTGCWSTEASVRRSYSSARTSRRTSEPPGGGGPRLPSDDRRSEGEAEELAPLVNAELPEDVGQVGRDGSPGDVELRRHLGVPPAERDLSDDLLLARCHSVQARIGPIVDRERG